MNINELMQGAPRVGGPMYPGGMPMPGVPPQGGMPQIPAQGGMPMPGMAGPPPGGQPQIPPQVLQMLLQRLMQQQGPQQMMQPPPQTEYEKWAVPGSIGSVPPGTTPLNQINGAFPPGMGQQRPMPTPAHTIGVRG